MSKTFLTCGLEFPTKLSKLVPTCSDDHFDEKKTFLKIDFFFEIWANFFPTFGKKCSANLAELLSKRSDEQYDVQPTTSLKSSSYLFGFWPKLFLKFRILFFAKVWKLFSKNWYEHFNQKNLFRKVLFKVFPNQIETFSDFRQKIHGEIVRSVFYVFKYMLKKQTFSIFFSFRCAIGLWAKLFWHVAQNFPQTCQIWFLRVQTTILMKKEVFWKLFFFVIWAIFSLTFVKKYSATLAEGPSKRLDEHFDVQQFLLKKCSIFGFWSKLFLNFCILFLKNCEKSFLRTDANTSIKKIFFENFSSYFGIGSKLFLIFGKNFTERLSELLSTFSKTSWRNRLFHFFSLFVV